MGILGKVLGGGDVIKQIGETVRQVLPNEQARLDFDYKMAELADKVDAREKELLQAQVEVNKVEAASTDPFVSRWRPFIGWTGGVIFAYTYMAAPLIGWVAKLYGYDIGLPSAGVDEVYPVLMGILGLGAMRSFDKVQAITKR